MKCALCHGKITRETGQYKFETEPLGEILVPDITFDECKNCGERTLSFEQSSKLFDYVKKIEAGKIKELPAGDLITANEAAAVLNVTKQAFSKNPKIKRGFIYSTQIGDRRYYSKKSTHRFKGTGDGRFLLTPKTEPIEPEIRYVVISIPYRSEERQHWDQGGRESSDLWMSPTFNSNPGADYAN